MPQHLRALLYDPTHGSADELVNAVMSAFNDRIGICVISTAQPKVLVEKAIVASDPSEVIDLSSGIKTERKLAIIETSDLAAVVLTSGTTNNPKPVELTMSGLNSSTQALYKRCQITKDDKWLCALPPFYVAGLAILGRAFISDAPVSLMPIFDVESFQESIDKNEITITSLVPTQLKKLFARKAKFGPLRKIILGGSKIDPELIEMGTLLGLDIYTSYGLTETWGGVCIDGEFLNNTQGRISEGHLEIKSGSIMSGYRHDLMLTQSKFTNDGWFKTGDLASINNGRLTVSGRSDELINSGGIKVSPENLEMAISRIIPELDFAICSTSHPNLGEAVTLCISSSMQNMVTLSALRADLLEFFPSTQLPTRLAAIDVIPKTSSGKIKRNTLSKTCRIVAEHPSIKAGE